MVGWFEEVEKRIRRLKRKTEKFIECAGELNGVKHLKLGSHFSHKTVMMGRQRYKK